jgi:hypothetical protein
MKILSIISENEETNEGPLRNIMPAFTKTQKLRKAAGKAAAGATKDEVRQMEVELLTYMEYSGQKRATPDVLKNYFKQKGLGNVGTSVVDAFVASKRPPANPNAGGAGAAGLGGNPPANPNSTGNPPPAPPSGAPTPPTGNPPPAPPQALPRGTKAKLASGEEFTWQGAQWKSNQTGRVASKAQKQELNQSAGMQTNSMYEAANPSALTKGEVRKIIQQVVQKAYGGAAGFSQSRFAEPGQAGASGGQGAPDINSFVNSLTPQQKAQLKAAL